MRKIPFVKMDGLGNDFMIIDERKETYDITADDIMALSDRKRGVGFDQMIILRPAENSNVNAVKMLIFNADGSSAGACGNGTRCVGSLLLAESGMDTIGIEAPGNRVLQVFKGDKIRVNMGKPKTAAEDIPLANSMDTSHVSGILDELPVGVAVNVGNPHIVFFVDDVMAVDLARLGPIIENHPFFPERINVEFAEVKSHDHIRMRVWERGAGITDACGTGACATLICAVRSHLSDRKAVIEMDGGELVIEWTWEGDIIMSGDTHKSFIGKACL